jgi:hypothetical protein
VVDEQMRWALRYIAETMDYDQLKTRIDTSKRDLKDWILDNCEQDESGNYVWDFDKPVIGDKDDSYRGLMLQRRVSEFIDEDKADEIIQAHNLQDRCYTTIEVIDFDQLYACNQEGVVSDEEIDSILSFNETFALIKVKK